MDRLTDEIAPSCAIPRPFFTSTIGQTCDTLPRSEGHAEWSFAISKISRLPSQLMPNFDHLMKVAMPKKSSLYPEENRAAQSRQPRFCASKQTQGGSL
jgi:hypothetical protein